MSTEEQAHAVISVLLVQRGIDPTPAAIVEVLNYSPMTDVQKLAIAVAIPKFEYVKSLNASS